MEPLNYDQLDLYSIERLTEARDFLAARADEAIDKKAWNDLEEFNRLIRLVQDEMFSLRRKTDDELMARYEELEANILAASKGPWDNAKHMQDEQDAVRGDVEEIEGIEYALKQREWINVEGTWVKTGD